MAETDERIPGLSLELERRMKSEADRSNIGWSEFLTDAVKREIARRSLLRRKEIFDFTGDCHSKCNETILELDRLVRAHPEIIAIDTARQVRIGISKFRESLNSLIESLPPLGDVDDSAQG